MFKEYGRFLVAMGLFCFCFVVLYCVVLYCVSERGPHFTPGWPQTFKVFLLQPLKYQDYRHEPPRLAKGFK